MTSTAAQTTQQFDSTRRDFDTVVVGGGQTGLVTGYYLQHEGLDFVILDASKRVGDAWRNRWDSLRLFTQAFMNGLPGMDLVGDKNSFVGKDEVADYLETYANAMGLPVMHATRVHRVARSDDGRFTVETNRGEFRCNQVVVAMADYQKPKVPAFAPDLSPDIVQMHSSQYRNAGQLQDGPVLVVGFGNSGTDIAHDVAQTHPTTIAGNPGPAIPFALEGWFGRHIGTRLVRFAMVRVLNTSTPIGRRARPKMLAAKKPPLVRVRPKEIADAGVARVGRIESVEEGRPVADDGTVLDIANVIWCTGFRPGFDWIDLPVFNEDGTPKHERGITEVPGLYFLGLFFLHAVWSETITGVQPDARYVVGHLSRHVASRQSVKAGA